MATPIERGENFVEDLAVHIERQLIKDGCSPEDAREKALSAAESARRTYQGGAIYVPSMKNQKVRERNRLLLGEFDGHNHTELAQKYGISVMRVYQILKQDKEEKKRARGGGLSMSGPSTSNPFKVD